MTATTWNSTKFDGYSTGFDAYSIRFDGYSPEFDADGGAGKPAGA